MSGDEATPPGGGGDGLSPVATALRELVPPRHGPTFWSDLDDRLADEPQLRLAPRSAIRPITQPPPVIDDRNLASTLKGVPPPRRGSSRRTVVATVVALVVVVVGIAALVDPDDRPTDTSTGTTAGEQAPTSEEAEAPPETEPTTTLPAGTIAPDAPLSTGGVGSLTVGSTLAELEAAGFEIQVDRQMYDSSGGTCYKGKVRGSLDLELKFRVPDGQRRAAEPGDGVLTSIAIESGLPTDRGTGSGLVLGSPQEQVLAAYGANLEEWSHPFVSSGRIFRADAGDGTGAAFFTDGQAVVRIAVGELAAVRFVNQCF